MRRPSRSTRKKVLYLKDGDVAAITRGGIYVTDFNGIRVIRTPQVMEWNIEEAGVCGYAHYMLKEIHEQPRSLNEAMISRVDALKGTIDLPSWASRRSRYASSGA